MDLFFRSAMARTVGVPCGVATQMILDKQITRTGVLAPLDKELYLPLLNALKERGIELKEEVVPE